MSWYPNDSSLAESWPSMDMGGPELNTTSLHVGMCMDTDYQTDTCMNTPGKENGCEVTNSHLIPTARIYQKVDTLYIIH